MSGDEREGLDSPDPADDQTSKTKERAKHPTHTHRITKQKPRGPHEGKLKKPKPLFRGSS